jgi:hypothetical protein
VSIPYACCDMHEKRVPMLAILVPVLTNGGSVSEGAYMNSSLRPILANLIKQLLPIAAGNHAPLPD